MAQQSSFKYSPLLEELIMSLVSGRAVLKFDGSSDTRISQDGMYYASVLEHPSHLYSLLSEELGFDPLTGRVSPAKEMRIIDTLAVVEDGRSLFHPLEARLTQSRWHGIRPMPHRHTYMAIHAGIREPAQKKVNPSLRNNENLQPVIHLSKAPTVDIIRRRVAAHLSLPEDFLNFVNVNLYWCGPDSKLGAHRDQDHRTPLREGPLAATVTLSPEAHDKGRVYKFLPDRKEDPEIRVRLKSGSLNVLGRIMNSSGVHSVEADKRNMHPRLSLNFRHVPIYRSFKRPLEPSTKITDISDEEE
jgi:hypothetical protein